MNVYLRYLSFFGFLLLSSTHVALAQDADTILKNGSILTVDDAFSTAESLAILDGRIIAVGTNADVAQHLGVNTAVIELDGKTVIPGLIDNHFHFVRSVWNYQYEVRLDSLSTRAAALDAIAEKAANSTPGDWIITIGGWSPIQFLDDNSAFTLMELDAAAPENPVYLMQSYSSGYANTSAFEQVGVNSGQSAELKGRTNLTPFTNVNTWRNQTADTNAVTTYMAELNRVGLTTVYDVGRPSEGSIGPVADVAASQDMNLRVFYSLKYSANDAQGAQDAIELIEQNAEQANSKDDQFGVLGLGEHIYTPVIDNAKHFGDWANNIWEPFSAVATAAAAHGWNVQEHIMSDATAGQFLDLVADIAETYPAVSDLRWTMAHVDGLQEDTMSRAYDLGVAVAVHSQSMMKASNTDAPMMGSIERSGLLWGLGSDASIVAPYNPFITLEWAITGQNIAGEPAWSEEQTVSREAALRAHTLSNAKLLFVEEDLGSLEIGKLADLVVLDSDYMTVDPTRISETQPVLTMTSGIVVYER